MTSSNNKNKTQGLLVITTLLQQRTIQVIIAVSTYLVLAKYLSLEIHQGLYAISLSIKDVLKIIMPITVAFFVAYTVSQFEKKAPLFILALIIFETLSNGSAAWYGYFAGLSVVDYLPQLSVKIFEANFMPLWKLDIKIPDWWSPDKGTLFGFGLGMLSVINYTSKLREYIDYGRSIMEFLLTRIFAPIVPIFIVGFTAHMYQTQLLYEMFKHYTVVVVLFVIILVVYILMLITIGAGPHLGRMMKHLKNLMPAGVTALISSCSFSTLPLTISGTEKNLDNPELAKGVIPATTNIQLIGDIVMNTFLCFIIYKNFYEMNPPFLDWCKFSVIFVIFRFATSCVLGGVFFLMIPIYEQYLNFTPEMIALLWAFNIILDPIITFGNVMGNGALCRIFEKFWVLFMSIAVSLFRNKLNQHS